MMRKIKFLRRRIKAMILHFLKKDLLILPQSRKRVVEYGSDYGAWAVLEDSLDDASTVLSFGIGTDASFDLALIDTFGLKVHAYDPTPKSINWVEDTIDNPNFVFSPVGLSQENGTLELYLPANSKFVSASLKEGEETSSNTITVQVKSLDTICRESALSKIDYLKMDIEGSEYGVICALKNLDRKLLPKQLAIEFHHFQSAFRRTDTLNSIKDLNELGYRIVWSSGTCREILFILAS